MIILMPQRLPSPPKRKLLEVLVALHVNKRLVEEKRLLKTGLQAEL